MINKPKWNEKIFLANVTAVQVDSSPVSTQMWDTSMDAVEKRVISWNADSFHRPIERVFVNIVTEPQGSDVKTTTTEYALKRGRSLHSIGPRLLAVRSWVSPGRTTQLNDWTAGRRLDGRLNDDWQNAVNDRQGE